MSTVIIPGTNEQLQQQPAPWPRRQDHAVRFPSELIVPYANGFDASGLAGTINSAACTRVLTKYGHAIATPRNPSGDPGFNFGKGSAVWGDQRTVAVAVVCNPGNLVFDAALLSASDGQFFSLKVNATTRVVTARMWNADITLGGYVLPSDGSLVVLVLRMMAGYVSLQANGVLVGTSAASNTWTSSGMYVGHIPGTYNEIDPIRVRWAAGWTSRLSYEESLLISEDFYGTYFELGDIEVQSVYGVPLLSNLSTGPITASTVTPEIKLNF